MATGSRLRLRGKLRAAVRRAARTQLDRALADLNDPQADLHATTHRVRQCCKRLRALLRLLRGSLEGKTYARESAALRQAQRRLSGLRDHEARIEALQALSKRVLDPMEIEACQVSLHALAARRERWLAGRSEDLQLRRQEVREQLQAVRERTQDWTLRRRDFDALSEGLHHGYRRGRRALARFLARPKIEASHEWRKRVKDHLYHIGLLERLHPVLMKARYRSFHSLAEMLGDDHDLALLQDHLKAQPIEAPEGETDRIMVASRSTALQAAIIQRRDELNQAAILLGRLAYAERPRSLIRRWAAWSRIHRQEGRRSQEF